MKNQGVSIWTRGGHFLDTGPKDHRTLQWLSYFEMSLTCQKFDGGVGGYYNS